MLLCHNRHVRHDDVVSTSGTEGLPVVVLITGTKALMMLFLHQAQKGLPVVVLTTGTKALMMLFLHQAQKASCCCITTGT